MNIEDNQPAMESTENVTVWQRVKPWVYMLIMFLSIMLSAKLFVGSIDKEAIRETDSIRVETPIEKNTDL